MFKGIWNQTPGKGAFVAGNTPAKLLAQINQIPGFVAGLKLRSEYVALY